MTKKTKKQKRLIRIAAVLTMTGLTRSTLYSEINKGRFPKQIKLSERCCAWDQDAVEAWMAARLAA